MTFPDLIPDATALLTVLLILLAIAAGWAVDRFLLGGEFTHGFMSEARHFMDQRRRRRRQISASNDSTPPTFGRR